MKTPEEIKKALACPVCVRDYLLGCSDCVYHGRELPPCLPAMHQDAIDCIQQLEEQIDLMKIQMQGDCGVCKNWNSDKCDECLTQTGHPLWEYEGLPESTKEERK